MYCKYSISDCSISCMELQSITARRSLKLLSRDFVHDFFINRDDNKVIGKFNYDQMVKRSNG